MHKSSLDAMAQFKSRYLDRYKSSPLKIADLGSYDVNGSYRPIFDHPGWEYLGLDISDGPNVDVVLNNLYAWKEIKSASVDVVITGQAFEHIEFFWLTILEIQRILKPGGYLFLVAPSSGPEHRYPLDCWRFYTDGMKSLAKFAALEVEEAWTRDNFDAFDDGSKMWKDSCLVARKPKLPFWVGMKATLRRLILQHFIFRKARL